MTNKTTVHTKAEFAQAKRDRVTEIQVVGELADELQKSKHIMCLGAGGFAILAVAICVMAAAAPSAFGLPFLPVLGEGVWTVLEIAAVVAATMLCAALLLAVYVGYDEVEAKPGFLKLRRMTRRYVAG